MIEVKSINFGYDAVEDRLLLDCIGGDAARTLLLTRRITRRLLHGFANALETSSPAVRRAPAEVRREVIALEHFSSLAVESRSTTPIRLRLRSRRSGSTASWCGRSTSKFSRWCSAWFAIRPRRRWSGCP